MTPNMQMEELSMAYVRAVAAYADCLVSRPEPDIDSVDGVLMSSSGRRPRIDFQAKATTQDILRNGELHFPLPLKNYNDLRADTMTPRLLVVLLMPEERSEWLKLTAEELGLRKCAYYLSLEGYLPTSNTSNVTVRIPVQNVFDSEQLSTLLQRIERGEALC